MRRFVLLFALGFFTACSSSNSAKPSGSGGTAGSDGGGAGGTGGTGGAPPSCDVHAVSGSPHFTDKTADWGLSGITGNRIIAVDLDGDDYPDLVVNSIGSNQRGAIAASGGSGGAAEAGADAGGADAGAAEAGADAGAAEAGASDAGLPAPPDMRTHILMNRPAPGGGRMFVDETVQSGYGATRDGAQDEIRSTQLAVAGNVDNDGDLDLFSGTFTDNSKVKSPPTPADKDRSELMLNDGKGHFTFGPKLEPYASNGLPVSGATFADVNRDGNIDLFVVGWYASYGFSYSGTQAHLLLGQGDGTFKEVTSSAGLTTNIIGGYANGTNARPAYGATSCDVDGDGDMDLLVSAYGRQWNQLYLNDGNGHFKDVGRDTGYAGDSITDYSDNQFFVCWCTANSDPACPKNPQPIIQCPNPAGAYWNPGTDDQLWRANGNTFTTACGDVNGDGVMDLYSAEIRHFHVGQSSDPSQLLLGNLSGDKLHYDRIAPDKNGMIFPHPTAGWNEGALMAALVDLDNDGRKDVIVANSDYPDQYSLVFHQKADGNFEEVGQSWGLHHACASGLAVADFDRDGDLDVVVGSGTARDCGKIWSKNEVHLYENDASTLGHWLAVKLQGKGGANKAAIGARVSVTAGGVTQMQEVGGGYGHFGQQNDLVLYYGLGACQSAEKVDIRWPDQKLSSSSEGVTAADKLVTWSGP